MFICGAHADLRSQLAGHINLMIPAERSLGDFAEILYEHGQIYQYSKANFPSDFFRVEELKTPTSIFKWQPFLSFEQLQFGSDYKSLEISHKPATSQITTSCTTGYLGNRKASTIDVLTVYSCVSYRFTKHKIERGLIGSHYENEKCKQPGFGRLCRWGDVKVPVGLTPDELAIVVQEAERRAALSMKKRLGFGAEPAAASQLAQSSKFRTTLSKLLALLPKSEYYFNDLLGVEISKAQTALQRALDGRADQGIRDRIVQILGTASHSNFLLAPTDSHLYFLVVHRNSNGTFDLHVRHFVTDQGKKLPTGAFATSLGAWKLERGGAGASPSIQQILAVFSYE